MALDRVPLRLDAAERAAVEELRGDRGLNTCLRRAVQQWIVRERALREAAILGLYEDGTPVRMAPTANGGAATEGAAPTNGAGRAARGHAQPSAPAPVPADPDDEDEDVFPPDANGNGDGDGQFDIDEPRRRRPPRAAESWGARDDDGT